MTLTKLRTGLDIILSSPPEMLRVSITQHLLLSGYKKAPHAAECQQRNPLNCVIELICVDLRPFIKNLIRKLTHV